MRVIVALALCLALAVALVAASSESPVPFLVWSPASVSSIKVVEERSMLANVRNMMTSFTAQTNTIVAFMYPKLSSAQFSAYEARFSNIKNRLEQAQSSVVVGQLMTSGLPVSQMLTSLTKRTSSLSMDQTCESTMNSLQQTNFQTASTNLLMLWYPESTDMTTQDACIERVLDYVHTATQGKYLAVLSSDSSNTVRMNFDSENAAQAVQSFRLQGVYTNTTAPPFPGVQYTTPVMLFAVLFGFFFLLALYCGVSCLHSVQTPLRFPSRKMPVGKEF